MIWTKWTIETKYEAADIVASVLFDNGIVGVEIEDNKNMTKSELDEMYVDIPLNKNDDDLANVVFYVSIQNDIEKTSIDDAKDNIDISYMVSKDNIYTKDKFDTIFANIKQDIENYAKFVDLGTLKISSENLDDKVFLNKWKENFKSFEIDNVCIVPSFDKKISNDNINIFIEPGNAFGTGKHETTKLCIKYINKIITNREATDDYKQISSFLDIGCGSGILGILAHKLNVSEVYAVDVDKNIEMNLKNNFELNDIKAIKINDCDDNLDNKTLNTYDESQKVYYGFGNLIDDDSFRKKILSRPFDMISINILTPIIIKHISNVKICDYLTKDGFLILSGILRENENDLKKLILSDKTLEIIDCSYENEWVAILIKKVSI